MRGIHFGALQEDDIRQDEAAHVAGIALDRLEAEQPTSGHHQRLTGEQTDLLQRLHQRNLAKQAVVPTADTQVREHLILIGQPITLFGEGPYERRERLKALLSDPAHNHRALLEQGLAEQAPQARSTAPDDSEEFFVPGSDDLVAARRWLTDYSLARAGVRMRGERQLRSDPVDRVKQFRLAMYERFRGLKNVSSQVGCDRPLSHGAFSPNGALYATAGFSGSCKVWSTATAEPVHSFRGHTSRTYCVRFHPGSELLASSAEDGLVALWRVGQAEPLALLQGHTAKVPRVAFHPSGQYLGSASFDQSWRLWDVERQQELQLQEGHSRPVYCIDFHRDGALVGTGGLDAIGRVWDLRVGKAIWTLQGEHVRGLLALKFAPSGYEVATGSEDCTVRLWDLRTLRPVYGLPAHTSTVSDLAFTPDGCGVVTASFDGTAKVWGRYGWKPLATLEGHGSKVMAVDVAPSGQIATASYDRTFKFWS